MATTKKSTGSSTGKTRTPPSTKGSPTKRKGLTNTQRNMHTGVWAHGKKRAADTAYSAAHAAHTAETHERVRKADTAYSWAKTSHGIYGHRTKSNINYAYNDALQELRTEHQAIRLENTTQAQIRRRQIQRQEGRRQAVVDTFTKAPSLPKGGGTAGSYIMILGVGSLVLIIAYVAFTHGPGTTNVLSTFTQFMTNLASEKPLFKETAANPNPNTISPNSTVGQVRAWLVKNKFPTTTQG